VTLLPGLIDVHTHIAMGDPPRNYNQERLQSDATDAAVRANVYARRTLEAGITSVRDLGAADYVDVALARAIDAGIVVGPRIQPATLGVGATGGQLRPGRRLRGAPRDHQRGLGHRRWRRQNP